MEEKNGYLYKSTARFEDSSRAKEHNNFNAHIWTPRVEAEYGAQKGKPFPGSDGRTYYTALYQTPEAGEIASKAVIDSIWDKSGNNSLKFASIHTGLPEDDPTVINYAYLIDQNKSKQDYEGAVARVKNRNTLIKKKEELQSEFPGQEKKVDKLIETGQFSADGIRDQINKVQTVVEDFDYETFKSDMMTSLDVTSDETTGMKNAFIRGYGNLKTMGNVLGYQLGINPEERIKQIAIEQAKLNGLPASEGFDKMMNPDNSFADVIKEFKGNYGTISAQLIAESMTQYLPAYATVGLPVYVAGAVVGAPIWLGTATAGGLASLGVEWSSEILNSFKQQGVDVTDPDQLAEAFATSEVNEKAKQEALEKGVPVAIFDAISGGVSGKVYGLARNFGVSGKITGIGAEIIQQSGLGSAGEYIGQRIALDPEEGETINIPAVVAEGIAEIASGSVTGTVNIVFDNGNVMEDVPENDPLVQDIVTARIKQYQEPTTEAETVYAEKISQLSKYKDQVGIGFSPTKIEEVATEQELIEADYNPNQFEDSLIKEGEQEYVNDGVNRYRVEVPAQNYEFGDGTRRVLLSKDATQSDFLEDTAEAIYTRLPENNQELRTNIDGWIAGVEQEAQLKGEPLSYTGSELFSKSFLNKLGYDTTLPSYASMPQELFDSFKGEMQLDDGTILTDGLEAESVKDFESFKRDMESIGFTKDAQVDQAQPKTTPPVVEAEAETEQAELDLSKPSEEKPKPVVEDKPKPVVVKEKARAVKKGKIYSHSEEKYVTAEFILKDKEFVITNDKDQRYATIEGIQVNDDFPDGIKYRAEVGINQNREITSVFKWKEVLEDDVQYTEARPKKWDKPKSEPVVTKEQPKPKAKPAKGTKDVISNYTTIKTDPSNILIDESRFQPREEYNQATIDNIANDYNEGNWNRPVLWKDPDNGKLYVVAGHHRQLGVLKGGYKNIEYKVMPEGTTIEEAIDISETSNEDRTEQTAFEKAKIIRRRKDRGDSHKKIFKDLPANKSLSAISDLLKISYLDPNGLFKEHFENTNEFKRVKEYGRKVGQYRKKYDWMTNTHEKDIFTYLYPENGIEGDLQAFDLNLNSTLKRMNAMDERPGSILKQLRKKPIALPEDTDNETKQKVEALDNQIASLTAQIDDETTLSQKAKEEGYKSEGKIAERVKELKKDLQKKRREILKEKQEFIEEFTSVNKDQETMFSLRPAQQKEYAKHFNKKVTRKEIRNANRDDKIYKTHQVRDNFKSFTSQLNRINPRISEKIRRFQKKHDDLLNSYLKESKPFNKTLKRMKSRARTRSAKANWIALKLALFNGDTATVESILSSKRRIKQYRTWKSMHEKLHEQAMAVGVDMGHIENHFPREVTDHKAFLADITKLTSHSTGSKLQDAIRDAQNQRNRPLTNEEKVAIANILMRQQKGLIGSGTPGFAKTRKIDKLTVDQLRFYDEPHNSLARYATGMTKMVASAQFLGGSPNRYSLRVFPKTTGIKGVGIFDQKVKQFLRKEDNGLLVFTDRKSPQAIKAMEVLRKEEQDRVGLPHMGLEDQVGNMIISLQAEFQLTDAQADRVRQLYSDYFNQDSMSPFVSGIRNIGYLSSMGSVFSAVTQLGDLGVAIYRSSRGKTLGLIRPATYTRVASEMFKSLTRLNKYKLKQLGVDNRIMQELSDNQSSMQRLMTWVFRLSGLRLMDKVGKETYVNTVMKKYEKGAKQLSKGKNNKLTRDLKARINRKFNQAESNQLIQDLADGKVTELTELLAYSELLDVQPVAKSEVPVGYLRRPNGRVFYMLKTFMLKRLDVFVTESQVLKAQGKHKASYMNWVVLGTALAMAEASADTIKDWMAGRQTPLSEKVISNLLKLVGVSRYHYYNFLNSKPSQAILKMFVPPFDWLDDPWQDIQYYRGKLDKYKNSRTPAKLAQRDMKKRGVKWIRNIPVVGKSLYWMDKDGYWGDLGKDLEELSPFLAPGYGKRTLKERLKRERNK